MNSRERVLCAISHEQPDRTPTDLQAVNEIWDKLRKHFNTTNDEKILTALEIDCRWLHPRYTGPAAKTFSDGTFEGWGGSLIRKVYNCYGAYDDIVKYALDEAETAADIERLLEAGGGRIDALQIADDFCTQQNPLMSTEMFKTYFKGHLKQFSDMVKSYRATTFLHCCGSAYKLIGEFIDVGVEILDPIQTTAANMAPNTLKKEFGDKLTFHGAAETQFILPFGTTEDVRKNAKELVQILGKNGGFILSSCHYLQADVPIENILALYEVANR